MKEKIVNLSYLVMSVLIMVALSGCRTTYHCTPSKKSRDWAIIKNEERVQYGWRYEARYATGRWQQAFECRAYKIGDTVCIREWRRVM